MAAATLTPETVVNSSLVPVSIHYGNSSSGITPDYASVNIYIINLILSLALNMYVVWLITTASGSGVASDLFSLNLSVCEIIVCFTSLPTILFIVGKVDICMKCFLYYAVIIFSILLEMGRPLFQCCVCVERYVAVVHPVTFLKYKPLRYRLAFSAVAWVTLLGICIINILLFNDIYWLYYSLLPYYLVLFFVKALCCVAVLKVLRQPGPGWGVRDPEVNPIKKKAFWLMMVLLVTIVINWCPAMFLIFVSNVLSETQKLKGSEIVFSSMVLTGFVHPLMYLHRSGKLPFIQC